uniref:Retrovirus-related Pol polyprotein from transposon TNT 1-94-like beta-barrel domain-containing protein n=1 Tax=Chenopodium quinoa TaxID=63459 RepID=A0A803MXR3_CHEQI
MSNNGLNPSAQPLIPIFKGEKYHLWSIKMQTMFKSQELWDIVEGGYTEASGEPDQRLRDNRKKDAKALFLIQSAVDDDIFPRISSAKTAKEAWEIIRHEYFGDKKVISVKLQALRSEFDGLQKTKKESMQQYLSKVSGIVNQMKSYGELLSNERVVSKVLRSLDPEFNGVVIAIEESKDLSTYTFDELMCSLLAHESRFKKDKEKGEEKALQVRGEPFVKGKGEASNNRGGRGGFRGAFRGRGRGRRHNGGFNQHSRSNIQCNYCKKNGHTETNCWSKQRGESKANFSEAPQEESNLFLAHSKLEPMEHGIWFVDSGCSNHMSGERKWFKSIDNTKQSVVRLGNDKQVKVEGRGIVAIPTCNGGTKLIHDVQNVKFNEEASWEDAKDSAQSPNSLLTNEEEETAHEMPQPNNNEVHKPPISPTRSASSTPSSERSSSSDQSSSSSDTPPRKMKSLSEKLGRRMNYLTHTRPDIMYSVSALSRYMHAPTMQHLGAAKRVLRYIRACQMVWLRRLLSEVGCEQKQATEIFCDNKATIAMTKNPAYHSRTKHIDIRFHYIRSLAAKKEVELKFCATNNQTADILTKALSFDKHTYFRQKMGVCSFEARGCIE